MIRKATLEDIRQLSYHLRNKGIEYFTVEQMKKDVENGSMYLLIIDGKIIGSVSLVETNFGWLGIKRLCIFNKKNGGKGYARQLLTYVVNSTNEEICITPWIDNAPMTRLVESIGFELEYIFNEVWCSYKINKKVLTTF